MAQSGSWKRGARRVAHHLQVGAATILIGAAPPCKCRMGVVSAASLHRLGRGPAGGEPPLGSRAMCKYMVCSMRGVRNTTIALRWAASAAS